MESREERIRKGRFMARLWWLAMSGQVAGSTELQQLLVDEGYDAAPRWLGDRHLRDALDEVCRRSQGKPEAPAPPAGLTSPEQVAVWTVIADEYAAFWNREFDRFSRHHVHAPYTSWRARIRGSGTTVHTGWDELARRVREDMEMDPDPNPYFTSYMRYENVTLRVVGDMAWATFDAVYPTDAMPGFVGPGTGHELRVLERHEGAWKIVLSSAMDEQFGKTEVPTWQVDAAGRVLRQNPAAIRFLRGEVEMAVRAGRMHLGDAATDKRFHEAIVRAANVNRGIIAANVPMPVLFDPGNDEQGRVWWVTAKSWKVFVTVNDPERAREQMGLATEVFQLSPSQTRLASLIIEGLTVVDAAAREGIRVTTARTQVQRIFDKVGVRNLSGLTRVLLTAGQQR